MFTSLSRNSDATNDTDCMVKLVTVLFITSFDGPPSRRNHATRSTDPLHLVRTEGQQIKAPLMRMLSSTVGHRSERVEMGPNLAWVDRVVHQG